MNQNTFALQDQLNRRVFMKSGAAAVGAAAFASLSGDVQARESGFPNFTPKAKRIIYLFQSGAPSQMDLFDPKPDMADHFGEDLPDSIRKGQRLTTMTSGQTSFPVAPSKFKFKQHGESGMWMSELIPNMASIADNFAWFDPCIPKRSTTTPRSRFAKPALNSPDVRASARGQVTDWAAKTKTYPRTSC